MQRVTTAQVSTGGETVTRIGPGLCVLVGVTHGDGPEQARRMATKLWGLRVFDDSDGVMNRSVGEIHEISGTGQTGGNGGEILLVSQFTLYGDTSRGRRPSWSAAARPEHAEPLVEAVAAELRSLGARVSTGRFGADMLVELANDGPVTVIVDV